MNYRYRICLSILVTGFCVACSFVYGQQGPRIKGAASFTVVPLGVKGGLDESNLSSYMVAPAGSSDYICLDAGTLYAGIRKAIDSGVFHATINEVFKNNIRAYLISHPHLDHLAGLIINSPDDGPKPIYGLQSCLEVLQDKYFTWEAWANFGDEGEKPQLKKYHYSVLQPGVETAIDHTTMAVKAFPLSHGNPSLAVRKTPVQPQETSYESTAFLVKSGDSRLLYLGDTGADSVERSDRLHQLWKAVAPLVSNGQLKAIFIEVSFPNAQPDKQLFGHLTPKWLMTEMSHLEQLNGKGSLKGLPVIITHRKPSGDQEAVIRKELEASNPLGLQLIFPEQARPMEF